MVRRPDRRPPVGAPPAGRGPRPALQMGASAGRLEAALLRAPAAPAPARRACAARARAAAARGRGSVSASAGSSSRAPVARGPAPGAGRRRALTGRGGVQSAEGFRRHALQGGRVIQHLLEFAGAASLQALPELFQDDARLAEAAARPPPRRP